MKVKDLCMMTVCLCLLIICSKISFQIGIIAFTLQTFAVAIIPYILKWKKSAIVFITYIIMGLIGIPVFSEGGGFLCVLKPSFGYILGFLVSTFITGSNIFKNSKIANLFKGLLGLIVLDIIGMAYMYILFKYHYNAYDKATLSFILKVGFLPFILKDSFSVALAYCISLRLNVVLDNMGTFNQELVNQ